jgi:hypothetical protein
MRNPIKKVCVFGVFTLATSFWSCSTDSDVVTVGADEQSEVQLIDESALDEKASVNEDDAKISSSSKKKSSSSKKSENGTSSSSKKKATSSSSKKVSAKSSSEKSGDTTTVSSSSSKKNSSSSKKNNGVSSSSKKADGESSSSSKKPRIPGMEDKTHNTPPKDDSSSSKEAIIPPPTPESSSSVIEYSQDTTTVVSDKDKDEKMEQLDPDEQKEIENLIENGDSTVTEIENPDKIDTDDLDFDNNEYYCKTPDGSWYRLKENKAKTFWKLLWDITVYVFTGHHWYDFTNVCDEMYMRPKNH